MNHIIKQLLIVLITFLLILWFQRCDDKKNNKIRKTLYEKYKLPLLVSSIVGLLLQANIRKKKFISWDSTELYAESPVSIDMIDTIGPPSPNNILRNPKLHLLFNDKIESSNFTNNILPPTSNILPPTNNILQEPKLNLPKIIDNSKFSNQQIYTDLPDF
jgi:hypothetical protein